MSKKTINIAEEFKDDNFNWNIYLKTALKNQDIKKEIEKLEAVLYYDYYCLPALYSLVMIYKNQNDYDSYDKAIAYCRDILKVIEIQDNKIKANLDSRFTKKHLLNLQKEVKQLKYTNRCCNCSNKKYVKDNSSCMWCSAHRECVERNKMKLSTKFYIICFIIGIIIAYIKLG